MTVDVVQLCLGLLGHGLVILLAVKFLKKLRPLHWMLLCLTTIDLAGLLVFIPIDLYIISVKFANKTEPLWATIVHTNAFTLPLGFGMCVELMICCSRLILIVSTRKYNSWFSQEKLNAYVTGSFFLNLLLTCGSANLNIFQQHIITIQPKAKPAIQILCKLTPVFFLCIRISNFVLYTRLYLKIQQFRDSGVRTQRDRLEGIITACFSGATLLLCWLPYCLIQILTPEAIDIHPGVLMLLGCLAHMTTSINPFVLTLRVTEFRNALKQLLNQNLGTPSADSNTVYQTSYKGFDREFREMLPTRINSILKKGRNWSFKKNKQVSSVGQSPQLKSANA